MGNDTELIMRGVCLETGADVLANILFAWMFWARSDIVGTNGRVSPYTSLLGNKRERDLRTSQEGGSPEGSISS